MKLPRSVRGGGGEQWEKNPNIWLITDHFTWQAKYNGGDKSGGKGGKFSSRVITILS